MKRNKKFLTILMLATLVTACVKEEDLEVSPNNVISEETVEIEQLVIAAYSALDYRYNTGDFRDFWPFDHAPSNWATSDIRSGDSYKGGGGTGDNPGGGMHQLELHDIFPSSENVYNLWRSINFGLNRINLAIRTIVNDESGFANADVRLGELKVLRAHFYFEAMKNFGSAVLYDETTPIGEINTIPNTFDANQIWSFIEADLNDAIALLPDAQTDLARANKMVAHAYLAKAHLFQQEWAEVITNTDILINSGQYQLVDDIERLYSEPGYGNSENIFAIQYSINDGTEFGNLDFGDLLNSPTGAPNGSDETHPYTGGDDFHKPSQNLVNAFKVGADGLPLFTSFNASDLAPGDLVDPRLDHAVGRPGITYKDWTIEAQQENWSRDVPTYGLYVRKKNIIYPSSDLRSTEGFPWAKGALDFPLIKFSDILLWKAEASIETGNIEQARLIINQIRDRAKNTPYVRSFDNPAQDAANYLIEPYPSAGWSASIAVEALRYERRIELANEGHRFYDLVRWGIADTYLNTYISEERGKRPYLVGANFSSPEEFLPIPQIEIDASGGIYQQRAGY